MTTTTTSTDEASRDDIASSWTLWPRRRPTDTQAMPVTAEAATAAMDGRVERSFEAMAARLRQVINLHHTATDLDKAGAVDALTFALTGFRSADARGDAILAALAPSTGGGVPAGERPPEVFYEPSLVRPSLRPGQVRPLNFRNPDSSAHSPFEVGKFDFRRGKSKNDNPYIYDPTERMSGHWHHGQWEDGYEEARHEDEEEATSFASSSKPAAPVPRDPDGLTLAQRLDKECDDLISLLAGAQDPDGPGIMRGDVEAMFGRIREAAGSTDGSLTKLVSSIRG